jgi:hypothetical protein
MQAKLAAGPVGHVVLGPNGPPAMGKHLGLWFAFCLLVSFVAGYLARHTLTYGIDGVLVMRVTGTLAFAAYGMSPLSDFIWKREPLGNTARAVLDALVYAVLTGLTFRLLWPDA